MTQRERREALILAARGCDVSMVLTPYDLCILSAEAKQECRRAIGRLRRQQEFEKAARERCLMP
jgi:hypothetical protein